jgi:hypothetical protein
VLSVERSMLRRAVRRALHFAVPNGLLWPLRCGMMLLGNMPSTLNRSAPF